MKKYPIKILALEDYPNGGSVKKGEIGVYYKDNIYKFPSQEYYRVTKEYIGYKYRDLDEPNYEIY